jgi:hypothetical protein
VDDVGLMPDERAQQLHGKRAVIPACDLVRFVAHCIEPMVADFWVVILFDKLPKVIHELMRFMYSVVIHKYLPYVLSKLPLMTIDTIDINGAINGAINGNH